MKKDMLYNLAATALPILVIQLVILPIVNTKTSQATYGSVIVYWSILNAVPVMVGNAICNARLLLDREYSKKNTSGDFNIILIIFAVAASCFMAVIARILECGTEEMIFLVATACAMVLYNYAIVFFRIEINYKRMLVSNVCMTVGYVIGLGLFLLGLSWATVFFLGQVCALGYLIWITPWRRESFCKTSLIKKCIGVTISLMIALLLAGLATYSDRLVLAPLAGNAVLAVYYIATLVGKLVVMAVGPCSSVLLSYMVKRDSISEVPVKKYLIVFVLMGSVFWVFACVVASPVLSLLYPDQANEALAYVPICTAASVFISGCSMFNALLMRFRDSRWQVMTNGTYFATICVLTPLFFAYAGLLGYCFAVLLSALVKFILILLLLYMDIRRGIQKHETKEALGVRQ